MVGTCRRQEKRGTRWVGGEIGGKFRSDLVGGLADAGADPGANPLGAGAERHHRRNRRLHDAGKRAAPAAMRGADDAGFWIGEQHWRAIRGEYAERDARHFRHGAVGARVVLAPPRPFDGHDLSAMDLVTTHQALRGEV